MRFLSYIESDPSQPFGPPPPALFEAIGAFGEEMAKLGVLLDQGGLAPIENSPHLRISGGKLTVTDGPFAEAKEVIGGFAMYDVRSADEAVEYSRRFMQVHLDTWPEFEGTSVVRQVFGPEAEMRFLVLIYVDENVDGAPSDGLMDAMEAHVADHRHAKVITDAGLSPSSSAVRITSRGGKITTTDGPFAEAKEVVGGFMLIEAASTEDAVAWQEGFAELHTTHWPELTVVTELRQVAGSLTDPE